MPMLYGRRISLTWVVFLLGNDFPGYKPCALDYDSFTQRYCLGELIPSIHKSYDKLTQTSAERLDLSVPKVSSTRLSRRPQLGGL
jgi:hypothetical protein